MRQLFIQLLYNPCMDNIISKLIVVNDACEMCASEYISKETDKLADMPLNQEKTEKLHRILHSARKMSSKPCVRYRCRETYDSFACHNICEKHLYQMIDAIKEYEDNANDR